MGHEKETINEINEQWEGRYWEITKYRVYLLNIEIDRRFVSFLFTKCITYTLMIHWHLMMIFLLFFFLSLNILPLEN